MYEYNFTLYSIPSTYLKYSVWSALIHVAYIYQCKAYGFMDLLASILGGMFLNTC